MKKNLVLRIGALALAGCCITMTMLSGTFAKYTSTVTGTATATVAKWSFKVNNNDSTTQTFSLTADGEKMAPGTSGKIELTLDGTESDTDIHYVIKLAKSADLADITLPDTFIIGTKNNGVITEIDSTGLEGDLGGNTKSKVVTIDWEWAYENSVDGSVAASDEKDLDFSKAMAAGNLSLYDITITAVQAAPESPTN